MTAPIDLVSITRIDGGVQLHCYTHSLPWPGPGERDDIEFCRRLTATGDEPVVAGLWALWSLLGGTDDERVIIPSAIVPHDDGDILWRELRGLPASTADEGVFEALIGDWYLRLVAAIERQTGTVFIRVPHIDPPAGLDNRRVTELPGARNGARQGGRA